MTQVRYGLLRITAVSGNPLTGPVSLLKLNFPDAYGRAFRFLTLTLTELVAPDGTDLMPVSTSTRIPIIVQ